MSLLRQSGILLPVFSLNSSYGIGTFGRGAYDFVDFLSNSKQHYWQILPLNPTAYGDSPYQSPCVFAGNPYFIDPDLLVDEGLLTQGEASSARQDNIGAVKYEKIYKERPSLLLKAAKGVDTLDKEYLHFKSDNAFWLEKYSEFCLLKELNHMQSFDRWQILDVSGSKLREKQELYTKIQFLFFRQWLALKKYANAKDVHIIGDLPIYPAKDSSDYVFNKSLFLHGTTAACPGDIFNPKGQLWGNPIYDWSKMESDGFSWWKKRLKQASQLFDTVRIDHFRGIYEYYSVKEGVPDANSGIWQKGSGLSFVNMIKECFPKLNIIAEDLGFLNEQVKHFFKKSGFPGMKILIFAFDGTDSEYLPHNYTENSVAYTGTHDNPTVRQWLTLAKEREILTAMDYFGVPNRSCLCDAFIRGAMASISRDAIIPLQDYMHIGAEGRINTPGTVGNNWLWRINEDDLSHNLSEKILNFTQTYKRTKE